MTFQEAWDRIERIGKFSVKNSNEHTRRCLRVLGDPDRAFSAIHVAGTNGKGSVCAFLSSVLRESGRKTALFTSPHLVNIRERMTIDGEMIPENAFVSAFEKVSAAADVMERNGEPRPSYFEFLFLMAAVWFAEEKVGIAVIETGLGGRLDATNSLERPLISVITSISYDHMQYLGDTIPAIAGEKAGIIRAGVPVVCDGSRPEAAAVITARADELGSECRTLDPAAYRVERMENGEIDFSTSFGYDKNDRFTIRALAPYQAENASLALLVLKTLRELCGEHCGEHFTAPDAETVKRGLLRMNWPGRMEEIAPGVYLDGAHNEDGILRFTEAAELIAGNDEASLIFSVVNDKDYAHMIRILTEGMRWKRIYVTEIEGSRRTEAAKLQELFAEAGRPDAVPAETFRDCYRMGIAERNGGCLFICGSLYLAGMAEEIIHDQL